eukprot:c29084_g1_i4 orf=378-3335(+)
MRSGFLNVVPSIPMALGSMSQEKGSRNKRKFRADPPSPLPLPVPICNDYDRGLNSENGSDNSNIWMGSRSLEDLSNGDANVGFSHKDVAVSTTTTCCNKDACNIQHDHAVAGKYFIQGQMRIPYPGVTLGDGNYEYEKISLTCEGTATSENYEEEQDFEEMQEPDWDNYSELQLEEVLLNMLDSIYKEAIKRLLSSGISEGDALKAVLRHGRCYGGRDAVSTIVENALACCRSSEPGTKNKEAAFTDLKQMEVYVLADMVCVLRKVRPFLSRGDAMWCLLICDMNVALACAMEDDAIPTLNRDTSSGIAPLHPKATASSSLVSPTPDGISSSQPTARLPNAVLQRTGSSMGSHREGPSAFSVPCFSSSPVGTVAVSHRQGYSNTSCSAGLVPCGKASYLNQEQQLQVGNFPNTNQLQLTRASDSVDQSDKFGSCHSECPISECSICRSNISICNQLVFESSEKLSNQLVGSVMGMGASQLTSMPISQSNAQLSHLTIGSSLSEFSSNEPVLQLSDPAGSILDTGSMSGSISQISVIDDDQVQTELQIGNSVRISRPHLTSRQVEINHNGANDSCSFTSAGTELSLAIASGDDNGTTGVLSGSRLSSGLEEATTCNVSHNMPINQFFGWTDADGEERKNEMLVQLVHRVKELEAQLQEWTEWAQQKVMQAARRLSKDSAELKALRVEREEYMRLKKEKQALEESTMKKLSEMENALRKASSQVDRANASVRRLEAENAEVRAEMEAAKLSAAESVSVCQEAAKREKKSLKKAQGWEKQKARLQEELAEEKRKLAVLEQNFSQAKERQQQAEVRLRQERKAKEEALLRADSEKRAKEQAENAAKRREDVLRRKFEADSQRRRDDIQRLESDIGRLRISSDTPLLRWESDFGVPSYNLDTCSAQTLKQMNARLLREIADLQDLSQRDIHRDRECVMCMSEEMSVVFLPCAHQVVCSKCNEMHEKEGLQDCPSCRTPIQQRIHVYGVSS